MRELPDIRTASLEDVPALIGLRERMLIELGSDDPERLADLAERSKPWIEQAFAEDRALGWIADRDGTVVGGMMMTLTETLPQYRSPNGKVASILGLFVEPNERGAGLARTMVQLAIEHARKWGADVVLLHAANKARPLYERLGFVATKEMRLQFSEVDAANPCGECGV